MTHIPKDNAFQHEHQNTDHLTASQDIWSKNSNHLGRDNRDHDHHHHIEEFSERTRTPESSTDNHTHAPSHAVSGWNVNKRAEKLFLVCISGCVCLFLVYFFIHWWRRRIHQQQLRQQQISQQQQRYHPQTAVYYMPINDQPVQHVKKRVVSVTGPGSGSTISSSSHQEYHHHHHYHQFSNHSRQDVENVPKACAQKECDVKYDNSSYSINSVTADDNHSNDNIESNNTAETKSRRVHFSSTATYYRTYES